ncbi:MAG: class I SAM-dependent methyltransferase [Mariprofundaceae bacterium]
MHKEANFWDKIAEKYSKQPIADEAAYQKKLKITQELFRPDMEVLELGCGTGSTAIVHAPYVKHIRAIDVSSNMIKIAKEKAAKEQIENITFDVAACGDISAPDESLDVVLGMSILHLLEEKEAMITKVYQMLKPGGYFVSNTACLTGAMKLIKPVILIGRLFGKMPQTVKFFGSKELEKSLTDAGFNIDYQWQPDKGKAVFIVAKKQE